MKKDVQLFGLRIPIDLREKLGVLAKKNERTVTAEIIFRLEQSVAVENQMMARREGNMFEAIYAANAAIGRHLQEIAAWMENWREAKENLKVAEERPDYTAVLNMLPAADREVLTLAHELSDDARKSLISLLKQTSGGKKS